MLRIGDAKKMTEQIVKGMCDNSFLLLVALLIILNF
jgi:hypothetical protein